MKTEDFEVVVIGAGQAGLSMSYYLAKKKIEHVILEQKLPASSWIEQRWDTFKLVTPNWQNQLPGLGYADQDPDGFLSKQEVIEYLGHFQKINQLAVRTNTKVLNVSRRKSDPLFEIETSHGLLRSKCVVVATGSFSQPAFPKEADLVSDQALQLHSSQYQNPHSLPNGAVLVIGGGQSGFQIASELRQEGREVYLSIGRSYWIPRMYRGKDIAFWLTELGVTSLPIEQFSAHPFTRLIPSPVITEKAAGFRGLIQEGIILTGRFCNASKDTLNFHRNLKSSFSESDLFFFQVTQLIDQFIEKRKIQALPKKSLKALLGRGIEVREVAALNLKKEKIQTIIWSTGFHHGLSWLNLPVFDQHGLPQYHRGISTEQGLYFLGFHRLYNLKSGSLFGVGEDAEFLAKHVSSYLAT